MDLFSPQGPGALTSRPATATVVYGATTWFKDCTPGVDSGTQISASFLNEVKGNLTYLVETTGVSHSPGDDTAVYDAIQFLARNSWAAGLGIHINISAGTIRSTLGMGTATVLDHSTISTTNDRVQLFDQSAGVIAEASPLNLIRGSISSTDGSVSIAVSGSKLDLSVAPSAIGVVQATIV